MVCYTPQKKWVYQILSYKQIFKNNFKSIFNRKWRLTSRGHWILNGVGKRSKDTDHGLGSLKCRLRAGDGHVGSLLGSALGIPSVEGKGRVQVWAKLGYGTNSTKISANQVGRSESGTDLSQAGMRERTALRRGHDPEQDDFFQPKAIFRDSWQGRADGRQHA